MYSRVFVLACVIFAFPATSSWSRDPIILGVGAKSCGSWTQERRDKSQISFTYAQWVLGYVTAFNVHVLEHDAGVSKGIDNQGLIAWIDTYCLSHPIDTVEEAADRLLTELMKKTGAF